MQWYTFLNDKQFVTKGHYLKIEAKRKGNLYTFISHLMAKERNERVKNKDTVGAGSGDGFLMKEMLSKIHV